MPVEGVRDIFEAGLLVALAMRTGMRELLRAGEGGAPSLAKRAPSTSVEG